MSSRDARRSESRARELERDARPSSRGPDGYRERERERDRRGDEGLGSSGSSRHRDHHHHHHHREHSHSHSRARSASRHERERERERLPGPPDRGQLPSSGVGPLPPPPPLPRGSSGRLQGGPAVGTPPHKERGEPLVRGGTPGSASRDGAQGTPGPGSGPLPSNSFLAEVMKHSKQIYGAKGSTQDRGGSGDEGEANGDMEDREAGEIDNQDGPGRKRKHSPIVWDPTHLHKQPRSATSGDAPAGRGSSEEESRGGGHYWGDEGRGASSRGRREGGYDLYERTAQEAAELKRRQMEEEDWDPEAPPAMKPSPSGSEGESPAHRKEENGHDSQAEDDEAGPSTKGIASRWLMDNGDEEEEGGGANSRAKQKGGGDDRAPSTSPAASADAEKAAQGQGVGSGGALPTSEAGDYELDDDSASPGQGGRHMQYDMRRECRSVDEFEKIDRISEGTYGVVYRAREKATGRIVALKRVKMEKERDGFPVTSVREISILLNFHHANIVNVEEVVISPKNPDHIFMVMEYMDHDLKSLMDDKQQMSRPFSVAESKCLMLQLLSGVSFLHQHWVLHRDIKTSNILYNSKGDLKLCDFGMARQYGDPLVPYTHLVVTLWYRAPELLLGQQLYSTAVDVWSCGCIMAEILTGKPLMPGHGELDQLDKMVQVLGTPTEEIWPGIKKLPNYGKVNLKKMPSQLRQRFTSGASFGGGGATLTEAGFDLLSRLLTWDPEQRITTEEALQHRWFSEPPLPQKKELMPMFAPRRAG